jgi:NADH-quinone oxidoreductase subunit L
MAASVVLVALGLGAGWALFGRRPRATATGPDPLAAAAPRLYAFLADQMRFDAFYAATLGRLNAFCAELADFLDRRLWGGAVSLLVRLGTRLGQMNGEIDRAGLNGGFNAAGDGIRGSGRAYSRAQTGEAHGYLRALALAFVVLALLVLFAGRQ